LASLLYANHSGAVKLSLYTLSLHDALPIYPYDSEMSYMAQGSYCIEAAKRAKSGQTPEAIIEHLDAMKQTMRAYFMVDEISAHRDRKSTRLNSSHVSISYAVFCLKKKKNKI